VLQILLNWRSPHIPKVKCILNKQKTTGSNIISQLCLIFWFETIPKRIFIENGQLIWNRTVKHEAADSFLNRFLYDNVKETSKLLFISCITPTPKDKQRNRDALQYATELRNTISDLKEKKVTKIHFKTPEKVIVLTQIIRSIIQRQKVTLQRFLSIIEFLH
jgi:hypothetical protein